MGQHLQPTSKGTRMKQDLELITEALEEAYKALTLDDKDIAMNCIVYVQSIINGTHKGGDARSDPDHVDHDQWLSDQDDAPRKTIESFKLTITWSDGKTEGIANDLPEHLDRDLREHLTELEDLREEQEIDDASWRA